ncbi:unnamed protein product [Lepeophtheirus salmonis]|uniref:(salmon louse) hypothetical protein n=1 Tax=Lepeophtheirus salmonis TaxID=72036 RepID=A0A7R8H5E7_LEPSM|nr:unnamed protein product [Lepeophtheirus salmonis]CAF2862205.1 unnamed protein product [Lepeophtheirus salmonis]
MLESVPKPCLKPQSSYSSDESNASSYESTSVQSQLVSYRKSVSFADSIGGDLCHIRTFAKGINDALMFEDDWWKDCALNPWNDEDEDEEHDDLDLLDYCTDYYGYIDETAEESDDNDIYNLPLYVVSSPPTKDSTPISFAQEIQSEESEVVRTFVAPGDLPEFDSILRERLFCVEDVNLTTMSGGGLRISGSLKLREPSSEPIPLVLPVSMDGWDSLLQMETFSILEEDCGNRHTFQVEARHLDLRVGDDLELQITATFGDKAKFQPGRSLW